METTLEKNSIHDSAAFKSYYVVWKPVYNVQENRGKTSLNRTMQYGNPFFECFEYLSEVGLNRTMQYGNENVRKMLFSFSHEFKSYYVVWKLEINSIIPAILKRLNRTMQYGNFRYIRIKFKKIMV